MPKVQSESASGLVLQNGATNKSHWQNSALSLKEQVRKAKRKCQEEVNDATTASVSSQKNYGLKPKPRIHKFSTNERHRMSAAQESLTACSANRMFGDVALLDLHSFRLARCHSFRIANLWACGVSCARLCVSCGVSKVILSYAIG